MAVPSAKDIQTESKRRFSKYLLPMKSSKTKPVAFAFGVAGGKDDKGKAVSYGFFMAHESKGPRDCLARLKEQAAAWDLAWQSATGNYGQLTFDGTHYTLDCELGLKSLKALFKAYLALVGHGSIKFRLNAPGGERDADDGDGSNAPAEVIVDVGDDIPAPPTRPVASEQSDDGIVAKQIKAPESVEIVFRQTRIDWERTRRKIESDIAALKQAIVEACEASGEYDMDDVHTGVVQLDDLLKKFDTRLIDKCDEALAADRPEARAARRKEAVAIVSEYLRTLLTDPIVKGFDDHGLIETHIEATLGGALKSLGSALQQTATASAR